MTALVVILSAVLSGVVSFPTFRWLADRGVIDRPNERSSHVRPTVRGGGIGFLGVILLVGSVLSIVRGEPRLAGLLAVAAAVGWVSMLDDLRTVPVTVRFAAHLGGAVLAVLLLQPWPMVLAIEGVSPASLLEWRVPPVLAVAMAILWIVGYTNAFNFMDGINGIAGGQAAITAIGMSLIAGVATHEPAGPPLLMGWVVGGAALGFLPHNFPRARMFMGDVGSAPLGFLLAALALGLAHQHGPRLLLPLALLHTNFILDTAITLTRRVWRGERWYAPHREHFYQRLIRAGRSHTFVTCWEMGLQGVTLGLLYRDVHGTGTVSWPIAASVVALWLAFFGYAEWQFRQKTTAAPQPPLQGLED